MCIETRPGEGAEQRQSPVSLGKAIVPIEAERIAASR